VNCTGFERLPVRQLQRGERRIADDDLDTAVLLATCSRSIAGDRSALAGPVAVILAASTRWLTTYDRTESARRCASPQQEDAGEAGCRAQARARA